MTDEYKIGIEEEFFLVDAETKAITASPPEDFLAAAKAACGAAVRSEMLQAQMEIVTDPHVDMRQAREDLRRLRKTIAEIASEHGLAVLAAGTHPSAVWGDAQKTEAARYETVMDELQMIGQRNMLCGMHVHVELPDPDDRVDVMYRMLPFLPLFIALSTSSPFWQSRPTGLKGYRLAAYDELPRTGVPELFRRREDFDEYVAALQRAGVIEDSSYVWWAIRPSMKLPTLELRAPDSCTFVDDTVAIASLYRTLARRLSRDPWLNWDLTPVMRAIVIENKWRAQRYGVQGTFVSENGAGAISVADFTEQVLEEIMPHAEALGCAAEVARCRTIVAGGTSADAQLAIFEKHGDGANHDEAVRAVADWLAAATLQ
jgi:carboxylate-amine ligase